MERYFYDWNTQTTNDPAYAHGVLPFNQDIFLNGGKALSNLPITRVISGEQGEVEYLVKDRGGKYVERDGELVRDKLFGRVEVRPPRQ